MTDLPPLPFASRRDAVLSRLEDGSMLLPASPIRFKNGDSEYRYRPDSELFYTTGWDDPGCIALLRGFAEKHRFVLFVPGRDPKQEVWTGPGRDADEVKAAFGADAVYLLRDFPDRGPGLLSGGDRIHYRLGASKICDRAVREALAAGRARRARHGAGAHGVADPGVVLDELRVRKDHSEIVRMKEAARISMAAFREALATVRPGVGEWEVEAAMEGGFRRRGAKGPAFATIVAAGVNGCTLHYGANDSRIGPGDLVLVDAGAEYEFYAADITRTVPAGGRLEGSRREVYDIVLRAHGAGLAVCRPGGSLAEVHQETVRTLAEGLVSLGVVRDTVEEVLEQKAYRPYFPHGTSHWLGLDTHDVGAYEDPGGPVRLRPGMAFTVEPGLYFRPGTCPGLPGLEGTAVRIEDDVLITEDGAEVLTRNLPADAEALEDLMRR